MIYNVLNLRYGTDDSLECFFYDSNKKEVKSCVVLNTHDIICYEWCVDHSHNRIIGDDNLMTLSVSIYNSNDFILINHEDLSEKTYFSYAYETVISNIMLLSIDKLLYNNEI
jgi:hypothetical protein